MDRLALRINFVYGWVMTVGDRLKRAREKLGKTQTDIANELGRTQPTVHAWESGDASPRAKDIRAVAKAYGLRPDQILPEAA